MTIWMSIWEVSKPADAAEVLLNGIQRGAREITNELLPSLTVEHPTGLVPLDACIAAVVQCIRAGWSFYLGIMTKQYVSPVSPE